jgi:hypothetical protein
VGRTSGEINAAIFDAVVWGALVSQFAPVLFVGCAQAQRGRDASRQLLQSTLNRWGK